MTAKAVEYFRYTVAHATVFVLAVEACTLSNEHQKLKSENNNYVDYKRFVVT